MRRGGEGEEGLKMGSTCSIVHEIVSIEGLHINDVMHCKKTNRVAVKMSDHGVLERMENKK